MSSAFFFFIPLSFLLDKFEFGMHVLRLKSRMVSNWGIGTPNPQHWVFLQGGKMTFIELAEVGSVV